MKQNEHSHNLPQQQQEQQRIEFNEEAIPSPPFANHNESIHINEDASLTALHSQGPNNNPYYHSNPNPNPNTIVDVNSIIHFLQMEATQCEERARSLRSFAEHLKIQSGQTIASATASATTTATEGTRTSTAATSLLLSSSNQYQPQYHQQSSLKPLKYTGKKRGRKPKKRKRIHNPNAPKRKHTAYTLFVQETYPKLKAQYYPPTGDSHNDKKFQSRDIIAMVAKQWKEMTSDTKRQWKDRAQLLSSLESNGSIDEDEAVDDDEEDIIEEDEGGKI